MSHNLHDAFYLEGVRSNLARLRKFKELIETYRFLGSEIKDLNTPRFWDALNVRSSLNKSENPMAYQKLVTVKKLLLGKNIKVLNVGLGAGNLENYLLKEKSDRKWYGIDISPKTVESAKTKFPDCEFKVSDINRIKFKDKFFDYVIILEVLEHVRPSKLFSALAEVNRVLKWRGKVIVSVPLNERLKEMIEKGKNPNAHVRVYTPELIKAELEIVGFKITKWKLLFAFRRNYALKTFISRYIFPKIRKPNDIIILGRKQ